MTGAPAHALPLMRHEAACHGYSCAAWPCYALLLLKSRGLPAILAGCSPLLLHGPAAAHTLLGYERRDAGVCPVVLHPLHGESEAASGTAGCARGTAVIQSLLPPLLLLLGSAPSACYSIPPQAAAPTQ